MDDLKTASEGRLGLKPLFKLCAFDGQIGLGKLKFHLDQATLGGIQ